jgi:hypothetical protein
MIDSAEHFVVSAVQFVPVQGFGTATIGRVRFYNHSCPADPSQHSSLADESVIANYDRRH